VTIYICVKFENLNSASLNLAFCGSAPKLGA